MLGVCVIVFAAMGIAASGAQGAASWLVLQPTGGIVTEGIGGEVTLEADTTTVLHSKISGVSILFECSTIAFIGAKLAAAGTIAKGAKIKFSGCRVKLNGMVSTACEPNNGGFEPGVILTKSLHAALVLHELVSGVKHERFQILPDEGETFWTTEMGKECSIGTKVPVIGKLFLKDCENALLTHQEIHLVEPESELTELFVISRTPEHIASLLGSWFAKVRTEGEFRSFAGHAG